MRYIYYLLFVVLVYIYLHSPMFSFGGGIGSIKYLYPMALLFFIFNNRKMYELYKYRDIIFVYFIIFLYLMYVCAVGSDTLFLYNTIISFVQTLVLSCFLTSVLFEYLPGVSMYRILFIVSSLASIITFLCFLKPEWNMYVRFHLQSLSDYLQENDFRGFGVSEGLTFAYGVIQGMTLSIWILKRKYDKWYALFVPFVLLSILVNARVGILIPVSFFLIYVLCERNMKIFLLSVCSLLLMGILFYSFDIGSYNEQTVVWLEDFFDEFVSLFVNGGQDSDTINVLTRRMIILPDTLSEWLFGSGEYVYGRTYRSSDVGYIIQLNYAGLIYMFLLFILLCRFLILCYKSKEYYLIILFFLTYLIGNMKGDFIPNGGSFRLISLVCIYVYQSYYCRRVCGNVKNNNRNYPKIMSC